MNRSTYWSAMGGALLGVSLAYWWDPRNGHRRRARTREKALHALHTGIDGAGVSGRDLLHRAHGLLAEAKAQVSEGPVDDDVLTERVRARLGHVCAHPHAVRVTARRGCVVLKGRILAEDYPEVLRALSKVRGVAAIDDDLEIHEDASGAPELQGTGKTGIRAPAFFHPQWAPAERALAGAAGVAAAVLGFSRQGPWGWALGLLGVGLITRAGINLPLGALLGALRAPEDLLAQADRAPRVEHHPVAPFGMRPPPTALPH